MSKQKLLKVRIIATERVRYSKVVTVTASRVAEWQAELAAKDKDSRKPCLLEDCFENEDIIDGDGVEDIEIEIIKPKRKKVAK